MSQDQLTQVQHETVEAVLEFACSPDPDRDVMVVVKGAETASWTTLRQFIDRFPSPGLRVFAADPGKARCVAEEIGWPVETYLHAFSRTLDQGALRAGQGGVGEGVCDLAVCLDLDRIDKVMMAAITTRLSVAGGRVLIVAERETGPPERPATFHRL